MSGLLFVNRNLEESFRRSRPSRISLAERRGAGKGARQRGAADPCRRALFGYRDPFDGRRSGNSLSVGEL
jgi:hypothetical protein